MTDAHRKSRIYPIPEEVMADDQLIYRSRASTKENQRACEETKQAVEESRKLLDRLEPRSPAS